MHSDTVFLNGQFLPLSEAKISVLDRGFLFGDGVYEVIPVYNRQFFHLPEHLQRLDSSLKNIYLPSPYNHQQWQKLLTALLQPIADQYIYLQITRGVMAKRDHAFPEAIEPTVFAMSSPIHQTTDLQQGVKAITLDDTRWGLCNVKAITLLANILLRQQAVEQDCTEAILIKDGYVSEGAASNIFAVIDDVLVTPPQNNDILPGITRDVILKIANTKQIMAAERMISAQELTTATEIWLTSSTREILPVVKLDSIVIADGKPGPIWKAMHQYFQQYKQAFCS
jgi:D-alanine transaminase